VEKWAFIELLVGKEPPERARFSPFEHLIIFVSLIIVSVRHEGHAMRVLEAAHNWG
jgi:hypothetical protein